MGIAVPHNAIRQLNALCWAMPAALQKYAAICNALIYKNGTLHLLYQKLCLMQWELEHINEHTIVVYLSRSKI